MYDTYAAFYEQEKDVHQAEIELFLSQTTLEEGDHVLDIACGNGFLALNAKKLVGNGIVTGIDINSKMLEFTNR